MRRILALLMLAAVAAGGGWWYWQHRTAPARSATLDLYGNVEIRQVDLSFGVEGPIAQVLVDEGDVVAADQVLATLDQDAFRFAAANAEASLQGAEQRLAELVAGPRAQEIDRARASVAAAEAGLENSVANLSRAVELVRHNNASQQALDSARMAQRTAGAALDVARAELALLLEGTRKEQIAQARAEVEARRADLDLARYRLRRSTLRAPNAGIVLTRVREPGAVVTPNSPVLTVSVIDPVWVRTYVDEPNLGLMVPGTAVAVTTDATPGATYVGHVGYVSPTAEFTPKSVETPGLRTALVYRVRIIVDNPDRALRQGMPATVILQKPAAAP
ncbi:MAG: efflux RND transporter periplasmic adaptor subunit [Dongiaceae bacterium]